MDTQVTLSLTSTWIREATNSSTVCVEGTITMRGNPSPMDARFKYTRERGAVHKDRLEFPEAKIWSEVAPSAEVRAALAKEVKRLVLRHLLNLRTKTFLAVERDLRQHLNNLKD